MFSLRAGLRPVRSKNKQHMTGTNQPAQNNLEKRRIEVFKEFLMVYLSCRYQPVSRNNAGNGIPN